MSPFVPATELPHLACRPDSDVLIGRWGYQPEPAALSAEYQRLQAMVRECHARHWLQDIRCYSYYPLAACRLFSRHGPALHTHIPAEAAFVPTSACAGRPHAAAFFGDEGEALVWLPAVG